MSCHVCRDRDTSRGFLNDSRDDRIYELCNACFDKLCYHMLNMLHESIAKKAQVTGEVTGKKGSTQKK